MTLVPPSNLTFTRLQVLFVDFSTYVSVGREPGVMLRKMSFTLPKSSSSEILHFSSSFTNRFQKAHANSSYQPQIFIFCLFSFKQIKSADTDEVKAFKTHNQNVAFT